MGYNKGWGFPDGSDSEESTYNLGDLGSVPGLEDPMEGCMTAHSSILAWRISMDRGAWRATVHGVTKSQTQLRTKHSTAQGTSQRDCVELQNL